MLNETILIPVEGAHLEGQLRLPDNPAAGVCVFVHGSGSSRFSTRYVANQLYEHGIGSLLLDLLTKEEEVRDAETSAYRFDIPMLTHRVVGVLDALRARPDTEQRLIGLFGASTGAAAALLAAQARPDIVQCVVSRGGRPDLVPATSLAAIQAPSLFIVGEQDPTVLLGNRGALEALGAPIKQLEVVPRATHLFPEPGALEHVAELACDWFGRHLAR